MNREETSIYRSPSRSKERQVHHRSNIHPKISDQRKKSPTKNNILSIS